MKHPSMPDLKLVLPPLNDFPFQKKYQTNNYKYKLSLPTLANDNGEPIILFGTTQDKFNRTNIYSTCPNCDAIPIITFKNHLEIDIRCTHCAYDKTITINEYIKLMQYKHIVNRICERIEVHKLRSGNLYCTTCKQWLCKECIFLHKNCFKEHLLIPEKINSQFQCVQHDLKDFTHYCYTCKCNFCQDCMVEHQTHNIVEILSTLNNELTQEVLNNFKEAKEYVHYMKDLKDKIIRNFTLIINEIENAYKENLRINKDILLLLGLILDTNQKSKNNFNNVSNLIRNFNFDLVKDEGITNEATKTNIDKLIYFYQNTFISFKEKFNCANLSSIKLINEIQTNKAQDRWINHILLFNDNKYLFVCKSDGMLQIVNLENFKMFKEIKAHDNAIHYILDLKTYLNESKHKRLYATCSTDKTIKIWTLSQKLHFKPIETINHHFKRVNMLINLNTGYHFASCSDDESIYIYTNTPPFSTIYCFFAHDNPITSIFQLRDERIVSASAQEQRIKVWNFETQKIRDIYKSGKFEEIHYKTKNKETDLFYFVFEINDVKCNNTNSMTQLSNGRLLVGGSFCIYLLDIFKGIIENKIEDKTINCVCSCMECIGGDVFCGCQYGKMIKINYYEKEITQSRENVCIVDINVIIRFDENHFITGDADGSVKLWSY